MENTNTLGRKLKLLENHMRSIISSSVGTDVGIRAGDSEWKYNTKTNTIFYATKGSSSIFNLTSWEVTGFLLHEIAHAKYTDEVEVVYLPDPKEEAASLLNVVEDLRIERKLMVRFPGSYDKFKHIASKEQALINDEVIKKVPPHINVMLNVRQKEWGFDSLFANKEAEEVFKQLEDAFESAINKDSAQEVCDEVFSTIWPIYSKLLPPPPPEPPKAPQPQAGGDSGPSDKDQEGEKEDDKKEQPEQGAGKPQGDDKKDEGEKDDKGGGNSKPDGDEETENGSGSSGGSEDSREPEPGEDLSDSTQGKGKPGEETISESSNETQGSNSGEAGQKNNTEFENDLNNASELKEYIAALIKESGLSQEEPDQSLIDELEEKGEEPKADEQATAQPYIRDYEIDDLRDKELLKGSVERFMSYEELSERVRPYFGYFRQKLNSIMEDNRIARHGGNYFSGRLKTSELYKWKVGDYRIFGRAVGRQNRDYAVTLLIDESSSMNSYNKNLNATLGAVLLAEVLNGVKIPFEIRGFNTRQVIYKRFHEPFNWTIKRNMEAILPSSYISGSGGTNDGYAINKAMASLNKQVGKKILIVLTDGDSSPSYHRIDDEDMIRLKGQFSAASHFDLKEEIHKAGRDAIVVGIGIKAPYVEKCYPQNVVCNDVEELPKILLNVLRKNIKRG